MFMLNQFMFMNHCNKICIYFIQEHEYGLCLLEHKYMYVCQRYENMY